jgi:hypothetical protein
MIRKLVGGIIALSLMFATIPMVFLYKTTVKLFLKEESLKDYLYQLSVNTSQFYAGFLYETEDWTTSSISYHRESLSYKIYVFRIFIDFLLGENHCKNSFKNERNEIKLGEKI